MPKKNLFSKIFASIILMSFVVGAFILVITMNERSRLVEESLIRENKMFAEVAAQIIKTGYLSANIPFETLKLISDGKDLIFLRVVKPSGEVYFADVPEMFGKIIQHPSLGAKQPVIQNAIDSSSGKTIKLIVFPLRMDLDEQPWNLFIGVSLESVAAAQRRVIIVSIGFFMAMIIVAILFSFYLAKRVTKPLSQLREGAVIIGKGNLNYRINIKTGDEIEELAQSFNKMAIGLGQSRAALEKRITELEKFHQLTVGRELKMIELKEALQQAKNEGFPTPGTEARV